MTCLRSKLSVALSLLCALVCWTSASRLVCLETNGFDLKVAWDPPASSDGVVAYRITVFSSGSDVPSTFLSVQTRFIIPGLTGANLLLFVTSINTNGVESVASPVIHYPEKAPCFVIVPANAEPLAGYRTSGQVLFTTGPDCEIQVASDSPWLIVTGVWPVGGQYAITYSADSNREGRLREAHLTVSGKVINVFQRPGGLRPPTILADLPPSATPIEGEDLQLSIQAEPESVLTYQWLKDGVRIPGATNAVYTRSAVGASDKGDYSVEVGNDIAVIENGPTHVSVLLKPVIANPDPPILIVPIGSQATITAPAVGDGLQFTWFLDGTMLTNTGSSVTIDSVAEADLGTYSVSVQNEAGSVEAIAAYLTSLQREQQIGRISVSVGSGLGFGVTALGVPGERYRIEISHDLIHWRLEDSVIVDDGGIFRIDAPVPSETGAAATWFVRTVRESQAAD